MTIQNFYGVLYNTLTVLVGSAVGLIFKKGIPDRISNMVMAALGLCTVYIGIDGALEGEKTMVLIISMILGTVIGSLIDIDKWINSLGLLVEKKLKPKSSKTSVAQGFVSASILFCIGSMTIVGSLNEGLKADNELIYTKATMDLVSSCILASTMGFGVMVSALFVLVFQGSLVLLSGLLGNVLTDPVIAEMTCAGSIMIIGIGLNLAGLSKFKVANMLPAIILVPFVYFCAQYLPI